MGVYLGYVQNLNSDGYYFKPLAELKNSALKFLTDADRKNLLPASESGNIRLHYWSNDKSKLEYWLQDKALAILEFETKILEPTYAYRKKGMQIGYKIDLMKFVMSRKIRPIQQENIFYASSSKDKSNGMIYELADDDFYAKIFIPNEKGTDSMTRNEYDTKVAELQKKIERLTAELKTVKVALANTGRELNDKTAAMEAERRRQNDAAEAEIERLTAELKNVEAERRRQNDAAKAEIERLTTALDDSSKKLNLQGTLGYLEERERELRQINRKLERQFEELLERKRQDILFDGFIANKMLTAAANWEAQNLDEQYTSLIGEIRKIQPDPKSPADLKDYLCYMIGLVRPNYTEADILNIAICLTQNFLTVFYGEPGTGKTSICNIFADVLGLNKIAAAVNDARACRYVPVSVEKGWTSKRDFVGYYNPLSKTFDKNNRRIYDALRILNLEGDNSALPFLILLDEANLSPMEFYWSDFMNLCDGLDQNSTVNLGEDFIYKIPATLRFAATINHDHTTEVLSPRLVDRAWIITLPEIKNVPVNEDKIDASAIEIISWQSLKNAFDPPNPSAKNFPDEDYRKIIDTLRKANITLSPRTSKAIWKYCTAAASFFDKNTALDFAVAQKILPKIHGSDDDFKSWLVSFQKICADAKLYKSAQIVQKIIDRGDKNLGYFKFFS